MQTPRSRVYEMSASKSRKRIDMSDMSRLLYVSSITRIPRWVRREVGHRNLRWLTAYVGAIGADAFSNVRRKTRPAGSCPAAHQGCSQSHWRTSLGRVAFGMARTATCRTSRTSRHPTSTRAKQTIRKPSKNACRFTLAE